MENDYVDKRILTPMKTDAELLSRATAESMDGGKRPNLQAIEIALQDLEQNKGA